MEPLTDNIENSESDREFYEYMERRRQRRLQKELREKRRKRIVATVLGTCVLLFIILILVKTIHKKETANGETREGISEEISIEDVVSETAPFEDMSATESAETMPEQASESISEEQPISSEGTQAYQFESTPDTMSIYTEEGLSSHAILVDANTDTIIAENRACERISPASMTKVLTVLVAAEAIEKASLDDTFTMTLEITDYAYVNDCSSVGFLDGEVVTVRDLFYGTVLPSGGDAAAGLATYVAGSHEAFVDMMNEKLEELGLSDSAHFTNCVGLYDENHYCTVYDMAVIMKAAMENELCREVLSAHIYTTTSTTQHPEGIEISNWFLRRIEDKDTGGTVIGAKTGYVDQAGSCAVSYEECADGTPYICVTVGARSSWRCIYDHVDIYNTYVPNGE